MPFILISTVVVLGGYLFITKTLTDNVSKANPKPQVEELASALKTLRSAQTEQMPAQSGDSTPLPLATPQEELSHNLTSELQSEINKQEQNAQRQRDEILRSLQKR